MPKKAEPGKAKPRKVKLTKREVEAAVPESKRYYLWDTEVRGLALRVSPAGRKTFEVFYRLKDGTQRFYRLDRYGSITAEQARRDALDVLAAVRQGQDPARGREDARKSAKVEDLFGRYLSEHARPHKKPRSVQEDERNYNKHIRPRLGRKRVASIDFEDIEQLHREMRGTPTAANRTVALLSKMFGLAEKWKWRPLNSNPCRHLTKYRETKKHRILSDLELRRLARALAEVEGDDPELRQNPRAVAAIRLALFSGMRRSEVLRLRWSEVDLDRGLLLLGDSKTGQKTVRLNLAAKEILQNQKRLVGNPYVFPSDRKPGRPLYELKGPWDKIRKRAKLEDVRLHDLRHHFATTAAARGLSLPMIGRLLGHKDQATTQRYAHLADDPAQQAAEEVGRAIAEAMKSEPKNTG